LPVLDDMISDIGFIGLKYSIGTALKYWEYVAFKYWDRDRRDIFGIGTALLGTVLFRKRWRWAHVVLLSPTSLDDGVRQLYSTIR